MCVSRADLGPIGADLGTTDQQDNPDFEFLLGTVNGVLNHGGVTDINLALRIGRTIAHLDLKDAEASDVTDKAMINSLVEDSGGFETMNNFIRQKVQDVLLVVRNGVEGGFNELHEMLARTTAADVKDLRGCGCCCDLSIHECVCVHVYVQGYMHAGRQVGRQAGMQVGS